MRRRVEKRDSRLPPPSREVDDYTIGLLGSEGHNFIQVKLSPQQVQFLLSLKDGFDTQGKGFGFQPEIEIYNGRLQNVGLKTDPVWEPKGLPVRKHRRIR